MTTDALAYWVEAPGRGALRPTSLPAPGAGDIELRTRCSGISVGTERLVGRGLVPATCAEAMACPGMRGTFALPVCYGYSLVGDVVSGQDAGRSAFVMHPHQDRAVVAAERVVLLPPGVPAERATLFANLETAWNAVWDAEPASGEEMVVVGGGAVGLLVAFVLSHAHDRPATVVDTDAGRRRFAARLPWVGTVATPEEVAAGRHAVAFHASGAGEGLQSALDAVGFEGRVIELSWYGGRAVTLRLGDTFHWQRKRIVASQVGTIARLHRAAGRGSRTAKVLQLLGDARLDALLGTPVPFRRLPELFDRIYRGETTEPCPVIAY